VPIVAAAAGAVLALAVRSNEIAREAGDETGRAAGDETGRAAGDETGLEARS
jgi:hypothetical protein